MCWRDKVKEYNVQKTSEVPSQTYDSRAPDNKRGSEHTEPEGFWDFVEKTARRVEEEWPEWKKKGWDVLDRHERRTLPSDNETHLRWVYSEWRENPMDSTNTSKENQLLENNSSVDKRVTPTPGSKWKHYNGLEYTVLFLTNEDSQYERHPPTVIYQGPNGKLWSRLVSDWHRSFTPLGSAFEEWWSIGPKLGDDETDKQLAEIAFEAGWEARGELRDEAAVAAFKIATMRRAQYAEYLLSREVNLAK